MIANIDLVEIVVENPLTSPERPRLRRGQIANPDQIHMGQPLWIHGPNNSSRRVIVIQLPFNCDGIRCVGLLPADAKGPAEKHHLADLSVIAYEDRGWNCDCWIGRF